MRLKNEHPNSYAQILFNHTFIYPHQLAQCIKFDFSADVHSIML